MSESADLLRKSSRLLSSWRRPSETWLLSSWMNSRKNLFKSKPRSPKWSSKSHQRKRSRSRSSPRVEARREELRKVLMDRRNEAGAETGTEETRGARRMPKEASGSLSQGRRRPQKISLMPRRRRRSLLSRLRPSLKPRKRCSHSRKISKRKPSKVLPKVSRKRKLKSRTKRRKRLKKLSHKKILRPKMLRPRCHS